MIDGLSYIHPLDRGDASLPEAFTFPFRYTPHPLCVRSAALVQEKLKEMGVTEGKMFGVMVVRGKAEEADGEGRLYFLAAYSGQLQGSFAHPWFVPPVVDYLSPSSHFLREQNAIVAMSHALEATRELEERRACQHRVQALRCEQAAAVAAAKQVYAEGKGAPRDENYIRMRQFQKAEIHRAKQLHKEEIAELESRLESWNQELHQLNEERKRRSEALQRWLFAQFDFLNGKGERKNLTEIFIGDAYRKRIPSGAGECCAPKLLQASYLLGLEPLAMAEFWWGPSSPGHYRQPGAFFPACHSKCRPILGHMLQGLKVEPDPAEHYDSQSLAPLRVVWEDDALAVIYKPEGWCSIPGRSHQANLFDEAHRLWPQITGSVVVHRLDQDTSGLMVVAKNAHVHRALCWQFECRGVKKRYVALVEGRIEGGGVIDLPLGPDLENMPRQRVDHEHGKEAVTRWEAQGVEERASGMVTRMTFYPQTGRTHQLRVHASSAEGLHAPIMGDRLYGKVADRLYLHAEAIEFEHPVRKERMHFEVAAPF